MSTNHNIPNYDHITNIDEVIAVLEKIIDESIINKDTTGYFAVLYHKVTNQIKEKIKEGFFDDNQRMETLDVIFAKRYIKAYYDYQDNKPVSLSWEKAFKISNNYWPIVLQHLLIGMNAHIGLDLGIATAKVSEGKNIEAIKGDFYKINEVLAALVTDVQNDLSSIWPTLKKILKFTGKIDDHLVNFSMTIARDEAWDFAVEISKANPTTKEKLIQNKDNKTAQLANLLINPGFIINLFFKIIRIGERGTIVSKIKALEQ